MRELRVARLADTVSRLRAGLVARSPIGTGRVFIAVSGALAAAPPGVGHAYFDAPAMSAALGLLDTPP